jgi:hypothetical protein
VEREGDGGCGRGNPSAQRAQPRCGGLGASRRSAEPEGNARARELGGERQARRKATWQVGVRVCLCAGMPVCGCAWGASRRTTGHRPNWCQSQEAGQHPRVSEPGRSRPTSKRVTAPGNRSGTQECARARTKPASTQESDCARKPARHPRVCLSKEEVGQHSREGLSQEACQHPRVCLSQEEAGPAPKSLGQEAGQHPRVCLSRDEAGQHPRA